MYRKEKDPITIYWAPFFEDSSALLEPDWNMLYQNPELLHLDLIYNKEKTSKNKSSFNCPAVNDRHSSSYVFKNNLRTTFGYDFSDVSNPIVQSFEGVHSDYYKQPNIVGSGYVRVSLKWVFFSEESVIAITNHPYAHRPTEYSINCLLIANQPLSILLNVAFILNSCICLAKMVYVKYIPIGTKIELRRSIFSVKLDVILPLFVDLTTYTIYTIINIKLNRTIRVFLSIY